MKKIIRKYFWSLPKFARPRVLGWLERRCQPGEEVVPGLYLPTREPENEMDALVQACGIDLRKQVVRVEANGRTVRDGVPTEFQ